MSSVFVLPRETDEEDGLIAVGERLLLKLDGDTARVLGVAPLRTLREFGTPGRRFTGAVALEPPLIVARYTGRNDLECWNCKNGKVVWTLELGSEIKQLAMSADGSLVAAGTREGELACLGSDGALRGEVQKLGSWIKQLAVSANGSLVAAVTKKGELACLGSDGALRGEVLKLGGEISQLAMSADGSMVAVGTEEGELACLGSDGALRGE
eukprot:COSAG06_NODE_22277_length_728_cov_5.756953_1_plen_210_part_01